MPSSLTRGLTPLMSLIRHSTASKAGSGHFAVTGSILCCKQKISGARHNTFVISARCFNSDSAVNMSVDITRQNFEEALPAVKDALERCSFFALDCEMTGLFTDGNKHEYLDDIQARYTKMTESSKSYIITQYGLSCFEATSPTSYQARTFNFYLFPQPHGPYNRRFLCDASSLVFLSEHGFDFNKCISQGVPYMPVRSRDYQLLQVNRSSEPREPITVTTDKDKAFIADLVQLVTDWLAGNMPSSSNMIPNGYATAAAGAMTDEDLMGSSVDESDAAAAVAAAAARLQHHELALPALNSYQRLLAYQELTKPQFGVEGHPGFWVKRLPDSRYLVLVRASPQEAEHFEAEAKAARISAIHDAAGFAAVFDLMRRSGKPAVGHNCMFDIAYGLYSFADAYLPSTWRDYKKMVNAWHPGGFYDTKYIAKQLDEVFGRDTSLATVYTELLHNEEAEGIQQLLQAASAAAGQPVQLPSITHAPGFDKYSSLAPGEAAHEAGYDAFMTGAAFARLLPLVAGKVAADPLSQLTMALKEAQEAAAAAASHKEQTSPMSASSAPTAQQQQEEQHVQPSPQVVQQQQQQPKADQGLDPLHHVQGVVGRLNMTFTDMSYAALRGVDPIPDRPNVFHLSGLQPGFRSDDVWRLLQRQGLGTARITPLDSSSCLAEFQPEFAPLVLPAVAAMSPSGIVAISWAEYAAMRYRQQVPEQLEFRASVPSLTPNATPTSRGTKRARFDEAALAQQQQQWQQHKQQQQQQQQQQLGGKVLIGADSSPLKPSIKKTELSDSSEDEQLDGQQPAQDSRCTVM